MNSRSPLGVKIFGIANIGLGIMPLIFLILKYMHNIYFAPVVFLYTLFGWVTDMGFKSFVDWFLLVIMQRGSLIILYTFSLLLVWSGIGLITNKVYSRRLTLVSIPVLVLSWITYLISVAMHRYLFHKEFFNVKSVMLDKIFLGLLIYALLIISYFMRPAIRDRFIDTNVKFPFKRIVLIILILIFGHLIIPGLGYVFLLTRRGG